jgi:hypothetical protein
MTSFSDNMRTTLVDMSRTIRAQIEIEKMKRPDVLVELLAIAGTAQDVEDQAVNAMSLTSTQLIGLMGVLRDAVQDLAMLTGD